jgi:hypothetical protein
MPDLPPPAPPPPQTGDVAQVVTDTPYLRKELLHGRFRTRKGRVMHRVYRTTGGGRGDRADLESMCRKGSGLKGVKTTHPRASGPETDWSAERYWYEDCTHCPGEAADD